MASLTDTLNPVEPSTREIDPPAPSGALAYGLEAISKGIGVYTEHAKAMAAQKRQAEEDATKSDTAAAINEVGNSQLPQNQPQAATPLNIPAFNPGPTPDVSFNTQPTPFNPNPNLIPADVQASISNSAATLGNIKVAVDQGKAPSIAYSAQLENQVNRLMQQHPFHKDLVLAGLKEAGFDTELYQGMRNDMSQQDAVRKAQADYTQKALNEGLTVTGGGLGHTQAEVLSAGMTSLKAQSDLQALTTSTNLQLQQANLTEQQKKVIDQQHAEDATRIGTTVVNQSLSGVVKQFQQLAGTIDSSGQMNPANEQQFQKLAPELIARGDAGIDTYVQSAIAAGSMKLEDADKMKTYLHGVWKTGTQDFLTNRAAAATNAVSAIQSSLKVDAATAMPFYTFLRTAGIDPMNIPPVMQSVSNNQALIDQINTNLKGIATLDPTSSAAHIALNNIMGALSGQKTLDDMPNKDAVTAVAASWNVARTQAGLVSQSKGDPDSFLNATGVVVQAAGRLTPQNSLSSQTQAVAAVASPEARAALIQLQTDPTHSERAKAVLLGTRGVAAVVLNNLRPAEQGTNRYWKVEYQDGIYKPVFQEKAYQQSVTNLPDRTKSMAHRPELPSSVQNIANTANVALTHLVNTSQYDPESPKGTPKELRDLWATGKQSASMKKDQVAALQPVDVSTQIQGMQKTVDSMIGNYNAPDLNAVDRIKSNPKYDQGNVSLFEGAANKYNVPTDIALKLGEHESHFNANADSGQAHGLGQVTPKTAARYGVTDITKLSPAENADLSMHILSDNYKKYVNWNDALAVYHSGVPLAQAIKEKRHDKNQTTQAYVSAING